MEMAAGLGVDDRSVMQHINASEAHHANAQAYPVGRVHSFLGNFNINTTSMHTIKMKNIETTAISTAATHYSTQSNYNYILQL